MAEPLKNCYTPEFIRDFLKSWKEIDPKINAEEFENKVFSSQWEALELKERMQHLAYCMIEVLPKKFDQCAEELIQLCRQLIQDGHPVNAFEYMFIPEVVAKSGKNDLSSTLACIEEITQFTSCEFVIRPFIVDHFEQVMHQMCLWSKHPHPNVRRLASEGCRPKLPWAMRLKSLETDPSPILPILENLKSDESLFVRKSVANNLNDISKDHQETVIQIAKSWLGNRKETDWIIKHACRTLLKEGHPKALKLFGYASTDLLSIKGPVLNNLSVEFGSHLSFQFEIKNKDSKDALVRLEYAIGLLKKNGSHSTKVFKISERSLYSGEHVSIERRHAFKPISTRKYYNGTHYLSLIVNGKIGSNHPFTLHNVH